MLDGALTVDLEDWQCALHPREGSGLDNRPEIDADSVCRNTRLLLQQLDCVGAKATFFVPGEVMRSVPELVKEAFRKGHEIASHASVHLPIDWIPRQRFEGMLAEDIDFLEDLIGVRPRGFRAPYFSIGRNQSWISEVLSRNGFWYDSSVVPTWTPYWGIPGAPKAPYIVDTSDVSKSSSEGCLLEIPVSVWPTWGSLPGLPVGGGFYMRIWPSSILIAVYRRILARGGRLVLYIHPGNLEGEKRRLSNLTTRDVLSQYFAAERGMTSFKRLAQEFSFGAIENVFRSDIQIFKDRLDRARVPSSPRGH